MPIPDRIRYINKKFTNRILIPLAGKKHSFIALLRHACRKSGLVYSIPILVVKQGKKFVFALTYGKGVDWYRNVMAANGASLVWHGVEYSLVEPTSLNPEEGRRCFGKVKGHILKIFGVNDFIKMRS
jgi:hypothetical protein